MLYRIGRLTFIFTIFFSSIFFIKAGAEHLKISGKIDTLSIYKMEPITDESTPKSENNQDIADIISSSLDKEFNQTYAGAYSSKDLQCLAEAVYYEARGEGNEGGIAVAEVVLNRTKSKRFPSTICGVVYDKYRNICQFSFACNGSMSKPKNRSSWSWAKNIANKVVEGRTEILSDGALFFHADYVNPSWANKMVKTARIGTHSFYRHR